MFRGSRLCWTQRLSPLCPAGDAIQPPADGTTDFPLFLHPPDELHPLRPAQLPVPSAGTSEAGQPSSRPFRHGRGRAAAPVPPGIRVSLVRKPACPPEAAGEGTWALWAPRRFLVACVPWRGGGETPARVRTLCARWTEQVWRRACGPARAGVLSVARGVGGGTGCPLQLVELDACASPSAWRPAGYGQAVSLQLSPPLTRAALLARLISATAP